jgi:hypothetical protein
MFASYQYRQDSIMPRISRWGGAWEFDTMEEARSEAKKQCGAKCISFMENDDVVGMDRLVNDYISTRQDVIKRERRQLASAKLGILLDHPHKPRAISTRRQRQLQAVIENDEIAIGYPDAQRDYLSACSDLVFYALLPVAPKTAHKDVLKLESLQRNGLYDFHTRTALMARDTSATSTGATVDQMARFAKSYQFANDSVVKRQVRLPKNLADAIAGETIRELWIEGSVRTWKDGTPLVEDREVSPLAIRTNKGFYLGVEIHMPDDHSSCSF